MSDTDAGTLVMKSNRTYDRLKTTALVALPLLATLVLGVSELWGLPNGLEIAGTITLFDTFLGALLGASKSAYDRSGAGTDGSLDVHEEDGVKRFVLNLDDANPYDLLEKDEITFRVSPPNQ